MLIRTMIKALPLTGHAELVEASLPLRPNRFNEAVEMLRPAQHDGQIAGPSKRHRLILSKHLNINLRPF